MSEIKVAGLDDEIMARLRQRAREHGRSPEEETRAIIEQVVGRKSREQLLAEADRIAAMTRGRVQDDSTDLIREDRDR
jgi:plasmid stability protein